MELISHKESIPWNRCLGSLKVKKFVLCTVSYPEEGLSSLCPLLLMRYIKHPPPPPRPHCASPSSCSFKATGSPDEYFLKAYKIKSVLYGYGHAPLVFEFLVCLLVEKKNINKEFACC
jgi:hypothetical protein